MEKLIELSLQRGRLQERIAAQRAALAVGLQPVIGAIETGERAVAASRRGLAYIRQHPVEIGIGVAVLAVLRPKAIWRWSRRSLVVWSFWKKLRPRLIEAGLLTPRSADHSPGH